LKTELFLAIKKTTIFQHLRTGKVHQQSNIKY